LDRFPTTQDDTNYPNGVDKSNYTLTSTDCKDFVFASDYCNATGHYPQTFQDWSYLGTLKPPLSGLAGITQWDNILQFDIMRLEVSRTA
jgi:hypothetical protein